jgi:N-acetylglucosaminyldiphosphoundecaprenol N-acetyl-beta-D-mannosaminyltransferase
MSQPRSEKILGLNFFIGSADQAIARILSTGGLVVVPAGPALITLPTSITYRQALLAADLIITDSAFMVLLWNLTHLHWVSKLSGLKYLRALLHQPDFRTPNATCWVMPSVQSCERNRAWLSEQGITLADENLYVAPIYSGTAQDPNLLAILERTRPRHILLGLGGGVQEPLGHYLKQNLSYAPCIHGVGAAIGFLSGDQVHIPVWVDALGLGWLWRTLSNPKRFFPRYWAARHLAALIFRYGSQMPPLK